VIRIARVQEPPALALVRVEKLVAARAALAVGEKAECKGYDVVKDDLARMQHHKCCYCEKLEEQPKYRDVEHYRPKASYWWLAWTWENLLFSCIDCNREYKRGQFPLEDGSSPLVPEQSPPGNELPLVLDPSDPVIDPVEQIRFRRERVQGNERWVPHGLTARGRKTIEVCGLDRPSLLDLYRRHVMNVVRPRVEPFFDAHRACNTKTAVKSWQTAIRSLLAPGQQFRALSHDALDVLVPPDLRGQYCLTLPRPQPEERLG
jgi:uncharacterized protein (TIGR02646 family)